MRFQARSGFTLIELLVVVVIIGILASIALPSFVGAQDRARNTNAVANLNVMRQGLELYASDHGSLFPDNAEIVSPTGFLQHNYLPGNHFPKSPWSTLPQAVRIQTTAYPFMCAEWLDDPVIGQNLPQPGDQASPPMVGSVGNPPTLLTHYGALSTDTVAVADRTRYVVNATGKKGNNAILAGWITNNGR